MKGDQSGLKTSSDILKVVSTFVPVPGPAKSRELPTMWTRTTKVKRVSSAPTKCWSKDQTGISNHGHIV